MGARTPLNCRTGMRVLRVAVLPLLLAVAGCAPDEVELNGKIFDAIGLNTKTKSTEPKLAERAPLVMPPDVNRVPEPGKPPEAAAPEVAALNDPDKLKKTTKAELERQQAEYCKKNYELAKAHGDSTGADLATGPLGPCKGSVLTAITNWTKSDSEEDEDAQ